MPELERRGDQLYYLKGQNQPFTGEFVKVGKGGFKVESASYAAGKLQGPTLFYIKEEQLKRRTDYVDGKRVRKRVWYGSGQLKADETWADDHVEGPCSYWFEDGRLRKQMRVVKNYELSGQVLEYAEDGTVLIDVILDQGQLVSGKWKPGAEKFLRRRYAQDENGEGEKEKSVEDVPTPPKGEEVVTQP